MTDQEYNDSKINDQCKICLDPINIRFYKDQYPNVDDIVICVATNVATTHVYAELIEYNNIEGMIGLRDISEKRIKNIKDFIEEGETYALLVVCVDENTGNIDLSNKFITEKDSALERFDRYRFAFNIFLKFVRKMMSISDTDEINELAIVLAEKTIWKVPRNDLMQRLIDIRVNNTMVDLWSLRITEKETFLNIINTSINGIEFTIQQTFKLIVYDIDASEKICTLFEQFDKIKLITTPNYAITIISNNRSEGIREITETFNQIKETIERDFINYNFTHKDISIQSNFDYLLEK
jgi:translation initiation factor 2 subunit 1